MIVGVRIGEIDTLSEWGYASAPIFLLVHRSLKVSG